MRGSGFASIAALLVSCHLVSGVHELEYVLGGAAGSGGRGPGANGTPCEDAASCDSNHCVDGVCCESACDATCSSCGITGSEGTCSLHATGTDPDQQCMSGTCDASGVCVGANYVFGTTLPELTIFDMAVRDDGDFFVVGGFTGAIDLGGGSLTSSGQDVVVARFSAMGEHVWSKNFGGTGADVARGVAVDKYGYVWLVGDIGGSMSFGGSTLTPNGATDFFLVKLEASAGDHVLSQSFEANESDAGWDIEIVDEDVFVLGTHGPYLQLPDISSEPFAGVFLARFDDDGVPSWARTYSADTGDAQLQGFHRLAVSADGDCVMVGGFEGELEFPDGVIAAASAIDGYIARVDANGNFAWSKRFAMNTAFATYPDVAIDAGGNVYVAGHFFDTTDLGSGELISPGDSDIFVASFLPDGRARWSRRFGDTAKQEARALVVDSEGTLVMTGLVQGKVDFGAGELSTAGQDAFLVRLAADGTHLFSAIYGNQAAQRGEALAIHGRSPVIAGHCDGGIDFGGDVKTCKPGAFVAGFSP